MSSLMNDNSPPQPLHYPLPLDSPAWFVTPPQHGYGDDPAYGDGHLSFPSSSKASRAIDARDKGYDKSYNDYHRRHGEPGHFRRTSERRSQSRRFAAGSARTLYSSIPRWRRRTRGGDIDHTTHLFKYGERERDTNAIVSSCTIVVVLRITCSRIRVDGGNRPVDRGSIEHERPAHHRSAMHPTLSERLTKMDMASKAVEKLGLKNSDLRKLADSGQGNGGSVEKVEHIPTGTIMAKKIIYVDAKSPLQKQILHELQIMQKCHSEYIILCYGSFSAGPNISFCLEFMDKGSFASIYKHNGPIDINVVCLVAHAVLEGLSYLYDVHGIFHRDVNPSSILLNSEGDIKLCDFSVSSELIGAIVMDTSTYMSPERIQGEEYTIKCDVWSLGITLIELATGRYPFYDTSSDLEHLVEEGSDSDDSDDEFLVHLEDKKTTHRDSTVAFNNRMQSRTDKRASKRMSRRSDLGADVTGAMSIIELMHQIVRGPAPRLGRSFCNEAQDFVDACLIKSPDERHGPKTLLEYSWMDAARDSEFGIKAWAATF
ncbi:hypothetical protein D9619_002345 [Psilocybe cf. subviscida]|uniref:Protein kinase domain-containing protein n=1 Tax=Psilocybe cf. subviscida TaxID=2480587 RepID=A0A8H5AX46_9AGAR|nr:hypothetical protein D9619_002345 [Psilocybe cf. subviscida]